MLQTFQRHKRVATPCRPKFARKEDMDVFQYTVMSRIRESQDSSLRLEPANVWPSEVEQRRLHRHRPGNANAPCVRLLVVSLNSAVRGTRVFSIRCRIQPYAASLPRLQLVG